MFGFVLSSNKARMAVARLALQSARKAAFSSISSASSATPTSLSSSSSAAIFSLPPSSQEMDPVYVELVRHGMRSYEDAKNEVDQAMDKILASNKLVLFMDGTPDIPKSVRSLNVLKILSGVQAVPLTSVDMFKHPAILGYATQKCHKMVGPFLFQNGHFYGNHDDLMNLYEAGELQRRIGTDNREKSSAFKGLLPIALY
eukprot:GHVS01088346.1.p1 GENE.GHVS01088346.1~~GHVS01088346.1.p1  ORF type:complete len:200 (+),score=31.62 GHVS01088346.1:150-749(+)